MPEGPSILILKEAAQQFIGRRVVAATCNNRSIDAALLVGQTITDLKSWGKHFLICFESVTVRVHMMMFGSYRINSHTDKPPRLHLGFEQGGEFNFYASQLKLITGPLDELYDWEADVMSSRWDTTKAIKKMKAIPGLLICDALMDQQIFSGVGNIIKNEVLYRTRVHPESEVSAIPSAKMREVIAETIKYSFEFFEQRKAGVLSRNWHAYNRKMCERDKVPLTKRDTGRSHRASYFCELCMRSYKNERVETRRTTKMLASKIITNENTDH